MAWSSTYVNAHPRDTHGLSLVLLTSALFAHAVVVAAAGPSTVASSR